MHTAWSVSACGGCMWRGTRQATPKFYGIATANLVCTLVSGAGIDRIRGVRRGPFMESRSLAADARRRPRSAALGPQLLAKVPDVTSLRRGGLALLQPAEADHQRSAPRLKPAVPRDSERQPPVLAMVQQNLEVTTTGVGTAHDHGSCLWLGFSPVELKLVGAEERGRAEQVRLPAVVHLQHGFVAEPHHQVKKHRPPARSAPVIRQ